MIEETQGDVYGLAKSLNNRSINDIWSSWKKDAKEAAERLDTGINLICTGDYNKGDVFPLDFPRKALTVLAAKTGGGKSTTMFNVAVELALQGKRGFFLSLEEPEVSICSKLMAIYDFKKKGIENAQTPNQFRYMLKNGKIDNWDLKADFEVDIMRRVLIVDANKHAASKEAASPSILFDPVALDAFTEQFKSIDFVMADYIQLFGTGELTSNNVLNIKRVMQAVKNLCGRHPVAVIMAAQLNREAAKLDIREWTAEMLREGADIEHGANMIVGMGKFDDQKNEGEKFVLRLLKNRDGNPMLSGVFKSHFSHQSIDFRNVEVLGDE